MTIKFSVPVEKMEVINIEPELNVSNFSTVSNYSSIPSGSVSNVSKSQSTALIWDNLTIAKSKKCQIRIGSRILYSSPERIILNNLTGIIKFGHLTAILGPSGAGKSTLIKSLFGTSTGYKKSGKLWINSRYKKSVFISQNEFDHLLDNLTVEESIYYSRMIKGSIFPSNRESSYSNLGFSSSSSSNLNSISNSSFSSNSNSKNSFSTGDSSNNSVDFNPWTSDGSSPFHHSSSSSSYNLNSGNKSSKNSGRNIEGKKKEKMSEVDSIIEKLGLTKCRYTQVNECSGGERKKLAIAQEVSSFPSPSIIFIDEPTSGLDSDASIKVISQLQSFVQSSGLSCDDETPVSIIVTIHQPSYKLLQFFHQIYVLSVNGSCIYSGSPGNDLRHALIEQGFDCSNGNNPADVVIEAASISTRNESSEETCINFSMYQSFKEGVKNWFKFNSNKSTSRNGQSSTSPPQISFISFNQMYDSMRRKDCDEIESKVQNVNLFTGIESNEIQLNGIELDNQSESNGRQSKVIEMEFIARNSIESKIEGVNLFKEMEEVSYLYSSSVPWSWNQFHYLLMRSVISCIIRRPSELLMRIIPTMIMGILLGFMYGHDIGYESGCISVYPFMVRFYTPKSLLEQIRETTKLEKNSSIIFFSLLFMSFMSMLPTVLTFPSEVKHFMAEKLNGWYPVSVYYWVKTFVEFITLYFVIYSFNFYIYWVTGNQGLYNLSGNGNETGRFQDYIFSSALIAYSCQGMALLSGTLFPSSFSNCILFSVSIMLFNVLFSGFFIQPTSGSIMEILSKLSFSKYGLESALIAVYGRNRCKDFKPESKFPVINTVLYKFNLSDDDFHSNMYILFAFLTSIRLLIYITLCIKSKIDFNHFYLFPFLSCSSFPQDTSLSYVIKYLFSILFSIISIIVLISFLLLLSVHWNIE